MTSTVQVKRSTTSGNVPPSLQEGQIALNLVDKRLFTANSTQIFDAVQNTASDFKITTSSGAAFRVGNTTVNAVCNSVSIVFSNSSVSYSPVTPYAQTAFQQQQYFSLATLTDGTSISWTVSSAQKAKVTLGGNRTMSAVTGAVEGATYLLWVLQDATGSRTLSWTTTGAGSFDFGTNGAPTLTTTASKGDLLSFEAITIASTLKLRFVGIAKGFG